MSSLENIKLLREKTGAGLGACKQALAECNNDVEAAVTFLRKKGLADMAKRAGRETKEGREAQEGGKAQVHRQSRDRRPHQGEGAGGV